MWQNVLTLDHPQQDVALTCFSSVPPPIVFSFKSRCLDWRKLTDTLCYDPWLLRETACLYSDVALSCWCPSCQAGHWELEPNGQPRQVTPALHLCFYMSTYRCLHHTAVDEVSLFLCIVVDIQTSLMKRTFNQRAVGWMLAVVFWYWVFYWLLQKFHTFLRMSYKDNFGSFNV